MGAVAYAFSGLLTGVFLLMAGTGAVGSAIPLRLGAEGVASHIVGVVSAAYFVGLVLGTLAGHRLIAGVGHIRAFATLAALLSAAILAQPLYPSAAAWAVDRALQGFCLAGLFMCSENWLHQKASDAMRGRLLALYMVVLYFGQGVGQMLLPIPDSTGFTLFVIAAVLVSASIVPVAAGRIAGPKRPRRARIQIAAMVRASPVAAAGALASGVMLGAFYGLVPFFMQETGSTVNETAQFMSLAIVGGVVLQWPVGLLSDRLERRLVVAGICICAALVSTCVVYTSSIAAIDVRFWAPPLGGALFSLYPVCAAQANDRLQPHERLGVSGGLILTYGMGAAAGPLLASAAMAAFEAAGLFYTLSTVALLTAAIALRRRATRPACPVEDKVPFQALPRTTPAACELNPSVDAAPLPADPAAAETAPVAAASGCEHAGPIAADMAGAAADEVTGPRPAE